MSCEDCCRWFYEPPDWRVKRKPANDPNGLPVLRPKGMRPPCGQCPKIPLPLAPGQEPRPALAVELTPQNRRVVQHYLECRAVGWNVADAADPLVRRNAAIIRAVEDVAERRRAGSIEGAVVKALAGAFGATRANRGRA